MDDARAAALLDQINALHEQAAEAASSSEAQESCAVERPQDAVTCHSDLYPRPRGESTRRILGGEDFPQKKTITLDINGGLFTGYFDGDKFHIESRSWPDGEVQAAEEATDREDRAPPVPSRVQSAEYDYRIDVPCSCGTMFVTAVAVVATRFSANLLLS